MTRGDSGIESRQFGVPSTKVALFLFALACKGDGSRRISACKGDGLVVGRWKKMFGRDLLCAEGYPQCGGMVGRWPLLLCPIMRL
jgi:hypothetical protein